MKKGTIGKKKREVRILSLIALTFIMAMPVFGATATEVNYNSDGTRQKIYAKINIRGKSRNNPNRNRPVQTVGTFVDRRVALATILSEMTKNNENKPVLDKAVQVTYVNGTSKSGRVYREIIEKDNSKKVLKNTLTITDFDDDDDNDDDAVDGGDTQQLYAINTYANNEVYSKARTSELEKDSIDIRYKAPVEYTEAVEKNLPDKSYGSGEKKDTLFDMVTKDTKFKTVYDDKAGYSIVTEPSDIASLLKSVGADKYTDKYEYNLDTNMVFYLRNNSDNNPEFARLIELSIKEQNKEAPRKITLEYVWEYKGKLESNLNSVGMSEANTYPKIDDIFTVYDPNVTTTMKLVSNYTGVTIPKTYREDSLEKLEKESKK